MAELKRDEKDEIRAHELRKEVAGLMLLAFASLSMLSLLSAGAGTVGELLSSIYYTLMGKGAFILPLLIGYTGILLIFHRLNRPSLQRQIGFVLAMVILLTVLHLELTNVPADTGYALEGNGGGVIGAVLVIYLKRFFGLGGTRIVLVTLGIISFILLTNIGLKSLLGSLSGTLRSLWPRRGTRRNDNTTRNSSGGTPEAAQKDRRANSAPQSKTTSSADAGTGSESSNGESDSTENIVFQEEFTPQTEEIESLDAVQEDSKSSYNLPPLRLLQKEEKSKSSRSRQEVKNNVEILEKTLNNFGVKGKVTQVAQGPTITRYELEPAPGIKVSKIVNLANDLALALAASSVRIEAPVPGKGVVGIEVPNKSSRLVRLRQILSTRDFINSPSRLTIALGKNIAGKPMVTDLTTMPHLLIAGATGSGKSVYINTLITSIVYKARPEEVKFVLIDPKRVELSDYDGIPHLISPVVTKPKEAAQALQWSVGEMERRYQAFADLGVRDIAGYNKLYKEKGEKIREELTSSDSMDTSSPMPYMVVLIDELSDLMMVAPDAVEDAICRLAQMARAAGIHLVIATQRPSVDVITGIIKANIPSRISFAVSSQTDSRTILDIGGAEKLLGNGDMLYSPVGMGKPVRIQSAFIADEEVKQMVAFLNKQGEPEYAEDILDEDLETAVTTEQQEDELYDTAVKLVVESGQASISMLQRKLRIGYNRAARLIDIMEENGVVGGYRGTKPREVLVDASDINSDERDVSKGGAE